MLLSEQIASGKKHCIMIVSVIYFSVILSQNITKLGFENTITSNLVKSGVSIKNGSRNSQLLRSFLQLFANGYLI